MKTAYKQTSFAYLVAGMDKLRLRSASAEAYDIEFSIVTLVIQIQSKKKIK